MLQHTPQRPLQPQPDSNDWMDYAQSVSEASTSARGGGDSAQPSTRSQQQQQQQQRGVASPDSDASTPTSLYRPLGRRTTTPLPGSHRSSMGGSGDMSGLLDAPDSRRGGMASAPATARSPLGQAAAVPAPSALHRLSHAGGPQATDGAAIDSGGDSGMPTPRVDAGGVGGLASSPASLARTASAPVGRMLQNALTDERRRQAGQMHQRGLSMAVRREVSVVDLAAPEAAVVVGRINTRLSHKATDRLVQVRLLGGMAGAGSA
jgi:hypothetical protein